MKLRKTGKWLLIPGIGLLILSLILLGAPYPVAFWVSLLLSVIINIIAGTLITTPIKSDGPSSSEKAR